jgi:hypothetical protein
VQRIDDLRAANPPDGDMARLDAIVRGEDAYVSHDAERVLVRPATSFRAWASTL